MLKKTLQPIREFGFLAGLLYGIDRLMMLYTSRCRVFCYEIMAQPVPDKALAPAGLTKSIEIREIRPGDPALSLMPPPSAVIDDRFDQQAICLGAFQKDRMIAYQWFCLGPYLEDEVRCRFVPLPAEEAVFDFDFYVFPESRLGIGFVALWDGANRYLRDRGFRFSCSRVSRFNLDSRKAHGHLKWKCAGKAVFVKVGRIQLMCATMPPYVHLSLGEASMPRVKIPADTVLQARRGS